MAKRSFNIGKLVKATNKQVYYEQQENCVCLSDRRGRIAIQTNDIAVFGELTKRGVELTEKKGLYQTINQIINKNGAENFYSYTATGIQFPYWDSSEGKKKILIMFRDQNQEHSVKLADTAYTEIFDPELIVGEKSQPDPILMICADCYGVVMPIRVKGQYIIDQKDDVKYLLDYFNNLHF